MYNIQRRKENATFQTNETKANVFAWGCSTQSSQGETVSYHSENPCALKNISKWIIYIYIKIN